MADKNYIIPGGGIIQDTSLGFSWVPVIPGLGIYIYTAATGWTGKVLGVSNPAKVIGVSNPAKVIGV